LTETVCIYCGSTEDLTADHVPPKGLFTTPLPSDLFTVPACRVCNQKVQLDDEYFRTTLALREEGDGVPGLANLRSSVVRDLNRPQKEGLVRAISRSSYRFQLFGPRGELIVDRPQFLLNESRIKSVVQRTVIGIHFRERHETHDPQTRFQTLSYREFANLSVDERDLCDFAMDLLTTIPSAVIAGGAFEYWYMDTPPVDGIRMIMCATEFYGRIGYLTICWRPSA